MRPCATSLSCSALTCVYLLQLTDDNIHWFSIIHSVDMLYWLLTCMYLQMTDDNIHWFSIINSFVIVVFLTGIVALIMLRILRKDFARYNELALSEVNPNLLFPL